VLNAAGSALLPGIGDRCNDPVSVYRANGELVARFGVVRSGGLAREVGRPPAGVYLIMTETGKVLQHRSVTAR
jgi:hypothetical protein